ncbi:MAG: Fic family protein [Deltaproteobacteria bacterium]|jgi:Fic family protein|nr:Fic family protein [Deltaproteobacteria bacterium]
MIRGLQGKYATTVTMGETVNAFVPFPLPPNPPIDWTNGLFDTINKAMLALGRLDSLSALLPDPYMFQYIYVRQEAVLSSKIEGTQSSLSELLLFELDEDSGVPINDAREVSNYVAALEYGLKRLNEGFPLSGRLLRDIHLELLRNTRGENQTPGEFRRSQNWIGGTRPGTASFVPPPYFQIPGCISNLEFFLNNIPNATPGLLKAAFAHVQFETIHPFLDGNGRLGRLLIILLLCYEKILKEPILYLSLYFKTHRDKYYNLLNQVRLTGDWESWLHFFAEAVDFTATGAVEKAKKIHQLSIDDQKSIFELGRAAASVQKIHQTLLKRPIGTSISLSKDTGLTVMTVNRSLERLRKLGIVKELTSKKRGRIFTYHKLLDIYNENIEG